MDGSPFACDCDSDPSAPRPGGHPKSRPTPNMAPEDAPGDTPVNVSEPCFVKSFKSSIRFRFLSRNFGSTHIGAFGVPLTDKSTELNR